MELCQELISKVYRDKIAELDLDIKQIIEMECYKALRQIKEIISNDNFDDKECFQKIEEIVSVFESLGSNGRGRHDFG